MRDFIQMWIVKVCESRHSTYYDYTINTIIVDAHANVLGVNIASDDSHKSWGAKMKSH